METQHLATSSMFPQSQKRFRCPVCDQAFSREPDCKRHLEVHKSENLRARFRCPLCPKVNIFLLACLSARSPYTTLQVYNRADNCFRHVRRNHRLADGSWF